METSTPQATRSFNHRQLQRAAMLGLMAAAASVALGQSCEWSAMGGFTTLGTIHTVAAYNGDLYIGGQVEDIGGASVNGIARWDGTAWSALSAGPGSFPKAMLEHDGFLYAGGFFNTAAGGVADRIARWDGATWSPVGTGFSRQFSSVEALTVYDGNLYVGGHLLATPTLATTAIAMWDGQEWKAVGAGVTGRIMDMVVFNDGTGPALYAGGNLETAGGLPAEGMARWDGQDWLPLGALANEMILALEVFDDGTGEALYAGWGYTYLVFGPLVTRWNGWYWEPVGAELTGPYFPAVKSLAVFDDGRGPALYAGGNFTQFGSTPVRSLARWDGATWSAVGGSMMQDGRSVNDMVVIGNSLFAGGDFVFAGGVDWAHRIARWSCQTAGGLCYANCDGSTTEPVLTVDDFTCFINEFAGAQSLPHEQQVASYANCDGSTSAPILTVDDFTCFINAFAQGCP